MHKSDRGFNDIYDIDARFKGLIKSQAAINVCFAGKRISGLTGQENTNVWYAAVGRVNINGEENQYLLQLVITEITGKADHLRFS